jgi:hypothetical protein
MCTTLLPQIRGPDDPVVRGGEPGGTRNGLTWDIHSHGQLVFVILGGELDIATAPGLPGGWRRSHSGGRPGCSPRGTTAARPGPDPPDGYCRTGVTDQRQRNGYGEPRCTG